MNIRVSKIKSYDIKKVDVIISLKISFFNNLFLCKNNGHYDNLDSNYTNCQFS